MLRRFNLPFQSITPDIDERRLEAESVTEQVARLARLKALKISQAHPDAVIIGCDQLAHCEGQTLGKPGTAENAKRQLANCSNRMVEFLSALHVLDGSDGAEFHDVVPTRAFFRQLSSAEIQRYVDLDNPLDCAGSFKSECGGTALLKRMVSDDPTAIIGLPLISLSEILRKCGFSVP